MSRAPRILRRIASPWSAALLGGLCLIPATLSGQAPDPVPSTKVVELTSFATVPTVPNSGNIDLDHPKDGSGRVFVATNEGKIFGFSANGEALGVFLDLAGPGGLPDFDPTLGGSLRGLSYMAFHPDYGLPGARGEGKLYTVAKVARPGERPPDYSGAELPTRPGNILGRFVVTEWTADPDDPDRVDPSSRREVLRIETAGTSQVPHSVGNIAFDPFARRGEAGYGLLHIPLGDMSGGPAIPNFQFVQDRDNPFGKILRIDPLADGDDPYSVPASNPYADGGPLLDDDGNVEEIYAWGFRNPQNLSFARDGNGASRLVVFDIGAGDFEEVNLVDIADNHGWTRWDGPVPGNTQTELRLPPGSRLEFPAAVYDHEIPNVPGAAPTAGPAAIVGGYVVSDPGDDDFQDQLVFADLSRGAFFHADFEALVEADAADRQAPVAVMDVRVDGGLPGPFPPQIGATRGDTRFGVDEGGRLFVVSRRTRTVFVTDWVADQVPPPVESDPEVLELNDSRFRVTTRWRTPQGTSGSGQAVALTDDSGTFWFFNEANVEVVVKVLDACVVNDRFWVFAAGLTNVEVELSVFDTETGSERVYRNPLETPFQPIQDTDAFATCP